MTSRSFISSGAWVACVLLAAWGLVPAAWAQGSAEDVHVTPRVQQPQTNNNQSAEDPGLKTHAKPIKVDVNLVLVSVSIVDPLNRQVTGLDKENFELFEGKERQEFGTSRVRTLPFRWARSSTSAAAWLARSIEHARRCWNSSR